ncbi:heparan-alpha-glucosaminide N-acetyltransferase domain-containing protein [Kribbella sp. NPDC050470]|uniref:heparan-alpha-glucosaminide N-acetyltransferase domain-containing protein n=1 Tax=unclassified Kribbella TaxID=2644121 RepID=UPI00379B4B6E
MVLHQARTDSSQDSSSVDGRARVSGVDAARGIALLGMMWVHIIPAVDESGRTSTAYLLASGRASALFAVLAGVGLALATGGRHPYQDGRLMLRRSGLVARASLLALVGLTLGAVDTPVAIILVYYALLFVCALPFLSLGARALVPLALGWSLLAPVLSHVVRSSLDESGGGNPTFGTLTDPQGLLTELFLTGYYPVLPWMAYLLAGLAVGRLALDSPRVAAGLLVGGAGLAVLSKAASWALLYPAGGLDRIVGSPALERRLSTSLGGTTPTTSWWWLAVSGPHSGTPLDLLHTIGTAVAMLGACLLVARRAAPLLRPLIAAGSMTLTLYSSHVVALGAAGDSADRAALLTIHIAVAVAFALLWRARHRRGPLETVVSATERSIRTLWARRSRSPSRLER